MKTADVQGLFQEQLALFSLADDVFGQTAADQEIASVRRAQATALRNAIGGYAKTNPEATSEEISTVLDPIWDAESDVLAGLPAPKTPTPREVSLAKLAVISQLTDLIPDDVPSPETLRVAKAQVAAAKK